MAEQAYSQVDNAKQAYETAKGTRDNLKESYDAACTEVDSAYAKYQTALNNQTKTNEKNADNITDKKTDYSITSKEVSNNLKNQANQVEQVETKLDSCVITAPISGYITSVYVEVGDTYDGSNIVEIQNMDTFLVDATVDEYDIADIQKGLTAIIKTDATDDEELEGEVTFVAPTPNSTQGNAGSSSNNSNYSIQITLKGQNERLRVGMTAKTSIVLDSREDVYAVAYDSVETDSDGNSYITVIDVGSFAGKKTDSETASEKISEMPSSEDGEMPEMPSNASGERPEMPSGTKRQKAESSKGASNSTQIATKKIQV